MKTIKEKVVIKCANKKELHECRKKLINFGFREDKSWNKTELEYPYGYYLLLDNSNNNIQFHNHTCDAKVLDFKDLDSYLSKTYEFDHENLSNDQKEIVRYWIGKIPLESLNLNGINSFIKEHLTPEFNPKVGTWYITTDDDGNEFLFNHQEEGTSYGFFKGVWSNTYWDTSCNWTNNPREATREEVELRLIEEAKRRGFVEGVKTIDIDGDKSEIIKGTFFINTLKRGLNAHLKSNDILGVTIFRNGQWAEIIDPKQEVRDKIEVLEKELKELKGML